MSKELVYEIPADSEPRACRGCAGVIYWVRTENDKAMPVNTDGKPHWYTCPQRDRFRRRK